MFKKALLAAVLGCACFGGQQAMADAPVNGYFRADGVYVAPHLPTKPARNNYPSPYPGRPRQLPYYYQSNAPASSPRINYPANMIDPYGRYVGPR